MSVILGSTGITFPDATTQTTAATAGGQMQAVVFATSTTWTCPSNVTKALVLAVGGGAGGVAATFSCGAYAIGGPGGICWALVTVVPATVYTITIGAGSAGVTSAVNATQTSSSGGTTSFGSLVTATGGGGGTANGSTQTGTNGTAGSGSTTGTLLRSSAVNGSLLATQYGYSASTVGVLGGRLLNTAGAAAAWSTSSTYTAGLSGLYIGGLAYGGVGGAILLQYVG